MYLVSSEPERQTLLSPTSRLGVTVDISSSYHNTSSEESESVDVSPVPSAAAHKNNRACGATSVCFIVALLLALPFGLLGGSSENGTEWSSMEESKSLASNLLPVSGKSEKKLSNACESDGKYSKHTLKTAYELPFAALFKDNKGQNVFEASSVTIVGDTVYAVCDSSWAISKFTDSLTPFSEENVQIGDPNANPREDSGYEAIFHHEGSFYVVRESILHDIEDGEKESTYRAVVQELNLGEDDYTVVSECSSEFEFEGDSKGFEGAVGFPDESGELYIIALCEGNYCKETHTKDTGNGRVVLMKKTQGVDVPGCMWETVNVIEIPKSADFHDYSAIDITTSGRVAISSQEDSSVWIGQVNGVDNGIIDPANLEFDGDVGNVYQFQKTSDCHTQYCNIEGIHFMNGEMLMGVSDKMKGHGRQDFRCFEKDQSIHAFVLP